MLTIKIVTESSLELIRNWRNAEHVRSNMIYQKYIDIDTHTRWFNELDGILDKYFIYYSDTIPVGVINLKNINLDLRYCEAGMYCGNPDFLGNPINVLAPLKLYSTAFKNLNIQYINARVLVENHRALKMNTDVGFRELERDHAIVYLTLQREIFKLIEKKFAEILGRISIEWTREHNALQSINGAQ